MVEGNPELASRCGSGLHFWDDRGGMSLDIQEAVMNRTSKSEKKLQKWVVLLVCLVVPALAFGQHKPLSLIHI